MLVCNYKKKKIEYKYYDKLAAEFGFPLLPQYFLNLPIT